LAHFNAEAKTTFLFRWIMFASAFEPILLYSSFWVVFLYALFKKRKDLASPPLGNKMEIRIDLKENTKKSELN